MEEPELGNNEEEEAMQVDGNAAPADVPMDMDTPGGEKQVAPKKDAASEAKVPATPATLAASSGLPQSAGELESLISTIHQTVTNTVLPRLQKCLTAKVRRAHTNPALTAVKAPSTSAVAEVCVFLF